jgi:hypothetical protein
MTSFVLFTAVVLVLLAVFIHLVAMRAYQPGFTNDFYYSATTYTGLGFGDIRPTGALRLFTAIEALTGLVIIAWTASAVFLAMQQYWGEDKLAECLNWNRLNSESMPLISRADI